MRKIIGGSFFGAAAVYLAVTKTPDLITFLAVAACTIIAGISTTRHAKWAIVGGAMLVAGSLFLQSVMSYRCFDCLKADIMIMAGVIFLSIVERGKQKTVVRMLASVMAVMMAFTLILDTQKGALAGTESQTEIKELRYIAADVDGRDVTLDTSLKPVLLFSPTCGPCARAVEVLVKEDPEGLRWAPVQVRGEQNMGKEYLKGKGYMGENFNTSWPGPVPVLVVTRDGKTVAIHEPEEMVKAIRSDAN